MLNRKGIISFLFITFGITYLMEGILILSGFRVTLVPAAIGQYTIMIAMWVPALATFITTRFITKEKLSSTLLSFGPSIKPYLFTALAVPVVFIITYLLTWALGLGKPDWQLTSFFELIASTGADMSTAPSPGLILLLLFVISLFAAPFINSIAAFGEEWGWRGYLLPRLMPLGKWKAYLLVGVIWGLWHAPLIAIGFNYPGTPVLGIVMMVLLTTMLGIFINEMTLHLPERHPCRLDPRCFQQPGLRHLAHAAVLRHQSRSGRHHRAGGHRGDHPYGAAHHAAP